MGSGTLDSKGQAEGIVMLVLLVVFVFAFVMINMWGTELLDTFTAEFAAENYTAEAQTALAVTNNTYSGGVDSIGMLAIIGLWLLAMVLGYNASSHPMLGFLALVLVGVIGLVGMLLSNSWYDISTDSDFSSVSGNFTMLDWVLDHYLIFVLVIGFSVALSFFAGASNS